MKKLLTVFLGLVLAIGCIGLTACGGSESEEQTEETTAAEEETAAPTQFWGEYGYMGEDPVEGAVYDKAQIEEK